MPKVTVGMPVYNGSEFLAETLRSILEQSYADLEVVISDNASTDSTREICSALARTDSRIRYVRQAYNIGAPRNYRTVLSLARGEYFKWSSANDICDRHLVRDCVAVLEMRSDCVLAYPSTRLFDTDIQNYVDYDENMVLEADDPIQRYRECTRRLRLNNILNALIRSSALKASTGHRDYMGSDTVLIPELALYGKFIGVSTSFFYRRMRRGAVFARDSVEDHQAYFPGQDLSDRALARKCLKQQLWGATTAPISLVDRIRLYLFLSRQAWWARRVLLGRTETAPIT